MAGKLVLLRAFTCPACGAPQELRAGGFAATFVCTSCRATIDLTEQRYAVLRKGTERSKFKDYQLLPLGLRGTFEDGIFEVIGFMVRCDRTGIYFWSEYLLFNPYKGFRWLLEMNDHWNFIRMTPVRLSSPGYKSLELEGMKFAKFITDQPRVRYVIGEFYWQVRVGEKVTSYDYIHPPYGVSCEVQEGEVVWSTMEYLPHTVVEQAFGLQGQLSQPTGISPTQPNTVPNIRTVITVALLAVTALCVLQSYFVHAAAARMVVTPVDYNFQVGDLDKIKRTEVFEIPSVGNFKIEVQAPVDNAWIDFDVDLVDANTQETRDASVEVAYYQGVDSDGAWSEGSYESSTVLGSVEPGRYYLAIESSADPKLSVMPYRVRALHDVPYYGNFVVALLLLLAYPIYAMFRYHLFEIQRWEDSDPDALEGA